MEYLIGEFLGTMTLCLFGSGVVASTLLGKSKGKTGGWFAITTGWAMAVLMGVFVAQAAGGAGDINPAISIAKALLGVAYPHPAQLAAVIFAQVLGGFCGGIFVWLAYYPHWAETPDANDKLMIFCTEPAIRRLPFNFLTELLATFLLVFGVGAISTLDQLSSMPSGSGAYYVALLVWAIGLSLGGPTGYAINPARDLGPRIAHALLPIPNKRSSDWSYAWVPVLGPIVGGAIGAFAWLIFF